MIVDVSRVMTVLSDEDKQRVFVDKMDRHLTLLCRPWQKDDIVERMTELMSDGMKDHSWSELNIKGGEFTCLHFDYMVKILSLDFGQDMIALSEFMTKHKLSLRLYYVEGENRFRFEHEA